MEATIERVPPPEKQTAVRAGGSLRTPGHCSGAWPKPASAQTRAVTSRVAINAEPEGRLGSSAGPGRNASRILHRERIRQRNPHYLSRTQGFE